MAVDRVIIVNPNKRKGVVAVTSKAAEVYKIVEPRDDDPMPSKNASKRAWVQYATRHGLTAAEAEDMTRDELVAYFTEE